MGFSDNSNFPFLFSFLSPSRFPSLLPLIMSTPQPQVETTESNSSLSSESPSELKHEESLADEKILLAPTTGVAKVELFANSITNKQRICLYGSFAVLSFVLSLGQLFFSWRGLQQSLIRLSQINTLDTPTSPPLPPSHSRRIPRWRQSMLFGSVFVLYLRSDWNLMHHVTGRISVCLPAANRQTRRCEHLFRSNYLSSLFRQSSPLDDTSNIKSHVLTLTSTRFSVERRLM